MSNSHRMLFEMLVPPLLAAAFLAVHSILIGADTIGMSILGFIPFLLILYLLGTIPSLIYMGVMECWFRKGMHKRCGLLCTVILSAAAGWGAAFLSGLIALGMGFLFKPDVLAFSWVGVGVGLFVGYYIGKRQIPT
jgi:hypothetical protein